MCTYIIMHDTKIAKKKIIKIGPENIYKMAIRYIGQGND